MCYNVIYQMSCWINTGWKGSVPIWHCTVFLALEVCCAFTMVTDSPLQLSKSIFIDTFYLWRWHHLVCSFFFLLLSSSFSVTFFYPAYTPLSIPQCVLVCMSERPSLFQTHLHTEASLSKQTPLLACWPFLPTVTCESWLACMCKPTEIWSPPSFPHWPHL